MLFSHLLPEARVRAMLDAAISEKETTLALLNERAGAIGTWGERFVNGLGRTVAEATLDYLKSQRCELEGASREAAE
jgi:uncharacterized protein YgfB (UPF0149 family)